MSPRARPQPDKNGSGTAKRQKQSFAPQKSAPNAARFFIKPYLNNTRECAKDMAAFNILKFIPFVGISLWATHGLWETPGTYQRCALAALIRPFPHFSQIIPLTRRKKGFQSVHAMRSRFAFPTAEISYAEWGTARGAQNLFAPRGFGAVGAVDFRHFFARGFEKPPQLFKAVCKIRVEPRVRHRARHGFAHNH